MSKVKCNYFTIYIGILFLLVLAVIFAGIHKTLSRTEQQKQNDDAGMTQSFSEVRFFPLAQWEEDCTFVFDDSFGGKRTYGGERTHEGIDIMTPDNIRGTYPVISVCDGIVTHIGWLELGGYRVGVVSEQGVYYYYAHLYRYDELITEGCTVSAGQILGYAGDSGYGEEGTTGQFDVHLHFGIYIQDEEGNEIAVNPYEVLQKLRNKIVRY